MVSGLVLEQESELALVPVPAAELEWELALVEHSPRLFAVGQAYRLQSAACLALGWK
jgi:hypothetical protein